MSRIMLVEDDELVGTMVKLNLTGEGFEVTWFRDAESALAAVRGQPFDLVLMDIMLPGITGVDGVSVLRRDGFGGPVLMLTSKGDVETKVRSFETGADDYLTKPFDVPELLARVKALLRRSQAAREIPSERMIAIGEHSVNLDSREAETREGPVVLTEKEAALLEFFSRNAGTTLARADILEEVWGMERSPTERTVDNFVLQLRRYFEEDPQRPHHFVTVRSVGYRFEG